MIYSCLDESPVQNALCVFAFKTPGLYILGYYTEFGSVKRFGKKNGLFDYDLFESFQYVLNKNNGLLFIK